jgi:hypothetical protein
MFVNTPLRESPADGAAGSLLGSAAMDEAAPANTPATDANAPAPAPAADGPTLDEATGRWSDVPEKFWDPEAKSLRVDERGLPAGLIKAHRELEKRFGEVPGKAEDYKVELGEGEQLEFDEESTKAFAAQAHEWGLTQKQFNAAVRAHLAAVADLQGRAQTATVEGAKAALVAHYGSEAAMGAELRDAFRAFKHFADAEEMAGIDELGNNPIAVRVLAKVAKALAEDRPPGGTVADATAAEIEALMKDRASPYWNPRAPGHDDAVRRVQKWHEMQVARNRG